MKRFKLQLLLLLSITSICSNSCNKDKKCAYDVIIYGGTSSGVIAAYSANQMGKSVLLIEDGKHLGGLTTSGISTANISNKHAVKGLARQFYRKLGDHYNKFEAWSFEPHVAESIFLDYINKNGIEVIYDHRIVDVKKDNGRIKSITIEYSPNPEKKTNKSFTGNLFIDCSYVGDLMAKAGVSYTIGRESNYLYNEKYNGVQLWNMHQFHPAISPYKTPGNRKSGLVFGVDNRKLAPRGSGDKKIQAYNYRLCLTKDTNNMIPIKAPNNYKPGKYELLRRVISRRAKWKWTQNLEDLYLSFTDVPNSKTIVNTKGPISTDFVGKNWDYPSASYAKRKSIEMEHKEYIQGLLYFLGHHKDVPKQLKSQMLAYGYAKDEFADNGHWPYEINVREARRMIGSYVMTDHNCRGEYKVKNGIAMGIRNMNTHNCQRIIHRGRIKNEGNVDIPVSPFPISYKAIVPKPEECTNLIVTVCLSATHIAYSSIRMEPVFMELGQAAGMAAALAIDQKTTVQNIDINKLIERKLNDPYIDGTPAEVLTDNMHDSLISKIGLWKIKINKKGGQYMDNFYLADKTNDDTSKCRIKFIPDIKVNKEYHVFFFCPNNLSNKAGDGWADSVRFKIKHKNDSAFVNANLSRYQNDWLPLGSYVFDTTGNYYVELIADEANAYVPADAVLWYPE
jgi:hypothetical protein